MPFSQDVLHRRATYAALSRHHKDDPDHPGVAAAHTALDEALAAHKINRAHELREAMASQAIQKIIAKAPPLSAEQRARLAVLLLSPTSDGRSAAS
jgi:uncharacterized membrane protein